MEIPHTTDLDDILDAIQEQTEEIQKLKKEIEELKKVMYCTFTSSSSLAMTDEEFEKEYGFDRKIFWVENKKI